MRGKVLGTLVLVAMETLNGNKMTAILQKGQKLYTTYDTHKYSNTKQIQQHKTIQTQHSTMQQQALTNQNIQQDT